MRDLPAVLLAKDRACKYLKIFTRSTLEDEADIQIADVESIAYLMADCAAKDNFTLCPEERVRAGDVRYVRLAPYTLLAFGT